MRSLLVFLKAPVAGQVKTRLASSIGAEQAAALYRQWIGVVFEKLQPIRGRTRLVACYDGGPLSKFAPWHHLADEWWRQPAGDLGHRLDAAFLDRKSAGYPAIALGTDCLDISDTLIEAAFDMLTGCDAVFGPADDGGYYLVGLSSYRPDFYDGIPWSTSRTLAAHQAWCVRHNWSFEVLPVLQDIDTLEDWLEYQGRNRA